jgi:putative membrane protein
LRRRIGSVAARAWVCGLIFNSVFCIAPGPRDVAYSRTIGRVMSNPPDPRVLFAAERTLLAWQRSSVALMGFGFVIERFSLLLSALRREPESPGHHLFSLLVGVALILLGAGVALASSVSYRRFVRSLPSEDVSSGYLIGLGSLISLVVAAAGIALALYLLVGAL